MIMVWMHDCCTSSRHVQGLQQHLEASHDAFQYGFPEEHPDVVPAINVRCRPYSEFDIRDYFGPKPATSETPEVILENTHALWAGSLNCSSASQYAEVLACMTSFTRKIFVSP